MSYGKQALALPVAAAVFGLSALLAACGGGAPSASVAHIGSTTTSAPPPRRPAPQARNCKSSSPACATTGCRTSRSS